MQAGIEYISPEGILNVNCGQSQFIITNVFGHAGFRVDGRRPNELRKVACKLGVLQQADGSAYLEQGNTRVLASVYGPHDVSSNVFFFWRLKYVTIVIRVRLFLIKQRL